MSGGHAADRVWLAVFTGNSGLTHYSYCLARALDEAGADVELVTNANYELGFLPAGFPVIRLFHRSRRYPVDLFRFWRRFERERPAVVHYQSFLKFPAAELLLLRLQKRKGCAVVGTAHDWLPHRRRFYHRFLMSRYYRTFDRVIVHSRQGEVFLADRLGVSPERLAVIPHGDYGFFAWDPELTRAEARRRLGLDPERFWFLFFGRIDAHKGLDVALRALAEVGAAGLVIAGNPEHGGTGEYEALAADPRLAGRVRFFTGHVPIEDVQIYFRAADAVVLPYRESSTSGIAHLAMGFGLPVVASDAGGMADVVQHGVTGILVKPGDERALAGAMERLAGDAELRRRLSEGWKAAAERHSWRKIAEKTLAVYEAAQRRVKYL